MSHPPIVSPEAWLAARTALLTEEQAFTRKDDAIDAQRRRLPMVKVTKGYVFTSTFNHDFHVTIDAAVAPATYDHREIAADTSFEVSGYSVFLRIEDEVSRSYSTYERGDRKAGRRRLSRGSHALWPAGGVGRLATRLAAAGRPRTAPPAEPRGPRTRAETLSGVAEPYPGTAPGGPTRPRDRASSRHPMRSVGIRRGQSWPP